LLAYISTPRYEGPEFDQLVVEEDAKQIYKAGEKRIGTDEKTFIRIFSERSTTHLAAVNTAYKTSFGNTLEKVNIIYNMATKIHLYYYYFCAYFISFFCHE
jgi:annexin A7/11